MSRYIIFSGKENFGEIEISIDYNIFTLISFKNLEIKINPGYKEKSISTKEISKGHSFYHYEITKRLHLYQLKNDLPLKLENAGTYNKIEKLILQYKNLPILLFLLFRVTNIISLPSENSEKSIGLTNNLSEIIDYKYVFIFGQLNSDELIVEDQGVHIISDVALNITGSSNSILTVDGHLNGNLKVGKVALGPASLTEGDIITTLLMISVGAQFNGNCTNDKKNWK